MGTLSISFGDEYPRQTTHRNKFVNHLRQVLQDDPNIFGENLRVSFNHNQVKSFHYKTGRYQTEKVNQLDQLSDALSNVEKRARKAND